MSRSESTAADNTAEYTAADSSTDKHTEFSLPEKHSRKKGVIIRLLTAAACTALLVWAAGPQELADRLSGCRPLPALAALAVFAAGVCSGGLAWQIILRSLNCHISMKDSQRLTWAGYALNSLTAGSIPGDAFRVWGAASSSGVPPAAAVLASAAELWSTVCAVSLAALLSWLEIREDLSAYSLPVISDALPVCAPLTRLDAAAGLGAAAVGAAALAAAALFWSAVRLSSRQVSELENGRPSDSTGKEHNKAGIFCGAACKIKNILASIGLDGESFSRQAACIHGPERGKFLKAMALAVAVSLLNPISDGLSCMLLAEALDIKAGFCFFTSLAPLFKTVSFLPISVNSIGPQEALAAAVWTPLNLRIDELAALSALMHLCRLAAAVPGLAALACTGIPSRKETEAKAQHH